MDLLQQARQQAHYSAPATTLICLLTPNLSKCGERLSQSGGQALSKSPRTGTATPYTFPGVCGPSVVLSAWSITHHSHLYFLKSFLSFPSPGLAPL